MIRRDIITNVDGTQCKETFILVVFEHKWDFLDRYIKNHKKKFKKLRPLRKNLLNEGGQTKCCTNKMKLTVVFFYFANNLKNRMKI